jgi:membrane-associated phospholipid phosphatase
MMRCALAAGLAACLLAAPAHGESGVESAADVLQYALPASAFGLTLAFDDLEGGHQLLRSSLSTLTATTALKYAVDAKRPNGGSHSFPSGHTAAAFSGASFIARRYGWRLGLPAYGAASFVAWSRVHTDDHHVEDVVAAAALAIVSSALLSEPLPSGLDLEVSAEPGSYGLLIRGLW